MILEKPSNLPSVLLVLSEGWRNFFRRRYIPCTQISLESVFGFAMRIIGLGHDCCYAFK